MNQDVLVLNHDFQPLNVCNARRAVVLVYLGKADVLHADGEIGTSVPGALVAMPSVLRLRTHVRRPMPELKLSRRTIFARDNYTCQYCGSLTKDLTIDHVVPRRHGGLHRWDNLVCCCRKCNMRKSDKLLNHVGMKLIRHPRRPRYIPYISMTKYLLGLKNTLWRPYLPVFADMPD